MEIRTQRLVLRPVSTDDFDTTYEYITDPENCRYMVFLPLASAQETADFLKEAEEEWKKPSPSFYEIAVVYNGIHIGCVSLYLSDDRLSAEIGWIISKRYQRQGFAYEAASALVVYAAKLGIRHLTAHCDTENTGSRRVMEKLGMTLTGEHGGRKNRLSDEERREYQYEMDLT